MLPALDEYRTASDLKPELPDPHSNIARILVSSSDCTVPDRIDGLDHARKAVKLGPLDGDFQTTLALAEYRAGDWALAIAAAERSNELSKGPTAANQFILAMALWQKGDKDRSRSFLEQAVSWTTKHDPKNAALLAFWREAALVLGQPVPDAGPLPDLPANPVAPLRKSGF